MPEMVTKSFYCDVKVTAQGIHLILDNNRITLLKWDDIKTMTRHYRKRLESYLFYTKLKSKETFRIYIKTSDKKEAKGIQKTFKQAYTAYKNKKKFEQTFKKQMYIEANVFN